MSNTKQSSKQQHNKAPTAALQALAKKRINTKINTLKETNETLNQQTEILINNNKRLQEEINNLKHNIKQLKKELKYIKKSLSETKESLRNDRWHLVQLKHKLVGIETINYCSTILYDMIKKELFSISDRLKRKLNTFSLFLLYIRFNIINMFLFL